MGKGGGKTGYNGGIWGLFMVLHISSNIKNSMKGSLHLDPALLGKHMYPEDLMACFH